MTTPARKLNANSNKDNQLYVAHSDQNLQPAAAPEKTKKIRILSIDGGGIKGILPATILVELERKLQEKKEGARICDYFDYFAGTSTGGILACTYVTPKPIQKDGESRRITAQDALDLYLEHGDEIFSASLLQKIKSLGGLIDEKYCSRNLENKLKEALGADVMLSETTKPCMITSYDIERRTAKFFTSVKAADDKQNFNLWQVARATSAAPVYFEPVKIKSKEGNESYALIDGGLFANNPALCAYSEVRKTQFSTMLGLEGKPDRPSAKNMMIVSIGTGSQKNSYAYDNMKDDGKIGWARPVIDMLMSSNSETVHHQLGMMFDTIEDESSRDYFRIEPKLYNASSEMDDASKENLENLRLAGAQNAKDFSETLDRVVEKLMENE